MPNLDDPAPQPVRLATRADRDAFVRALSAAFYDDPLMRWVFPRDSRRLAALRRIHQMETDAFMDAGLVFLSANQQAAATWLPPGAKESVGPLTVLRHFPAWLAASSLRRAMHARRALAMTEAKRPKQPHYYLGSVGAHPDFQGQGLGSALLDEMMPRIDAEGVPSYLLSSNARNLPLYQRYGYRILEELDHSLIPCPATGGSAQEERAMSVYLVAQARVTDQAKLDEYVAKVAATLPAEVKILSIDETAEIVEGEVGPRTVIIEFPSRESFRAWYDSPAYQAILPLRTESTDGSLIVADGFSPD